MRRIKKKIKKQSKGMVKSQAYLREGDWRIQTGKIDLPKCFE